MSSTHLLLTCLTMFALSVGQVLFKLAARQMDGGIPTLAQLVFNVPLLAALVVYGLATIAWIALLRYVPLTIAYPFVALAFFIVPVMAHFVLAEPLRWQNLAGAAFILVGVWISVAYE